MKIIPQTRMSKIFFAVVVLIALLFAFILTMEIYGRVSGIKAVDDLAKQLKQQEQELYARKAADTIGGKTPQETLEMFITAAEAGDYELASKYFVIEKQEEELKSLQSSPKENIENVMTMLKKTDFSNGGYSDDKKSFSAHDPLLVSFILYPSGNWKIDKI